MIKSWIFARAQEPSTWRGFGGLLVSLGLVSMGSVDAVISAGVALAAVVDVVRKGG